MKYILRSRRAADLQRVTDKRKAGDVQAVLNRSVAKRPDFVLVSIALDLIPEALEASDDFIWVPRQTAALTNPDQAMVAHQFDDICPGWRDEGISSNSIFDYARKFDYSAYCYFNNRLLESYKGTRRSLC